MNNSKHSTSQSLFSNCVGPNVSAYYVIFVFQAHGALDSVYYICVKEISTEQLGQVCIPQHFRDAKSMVIDI